jgi:cell division transport system permease protein
MKKRVNYFYAILSVALVLFILGFFALTVLHTSKLVSLFKERVDIWLELKPDTPRSEADRLTGVLRKSPFVKPGTVSYITREEAAAALQQDLGSENMPADAPDLLRDIVRFNVRADFLETDSLQAVRNLFRRDSAVSELYFEATQTAHVGKNIKNLGWFTLALCVLLLFAAVTLIHNTIRLALYTNRFIIKNQELVGASWSFISRPYLQRGLINGLLSALLSIVMLLVLIWRSEAAMPELRELRDPATLAALFAGLVLIGVGVSGLSTWVVVQRFLRMRLDELY